MLIALYTTDIGPRRVKEQESKGTREPESKGLKNKRVREEKS
jgi:hypothetical protein